MDKIYTTSWGYKINESSFRYEYEPHIKEWMCSYGDYCGRGKTKEEAYDNLLNDIESPTE